LILLICSSLEFQFVGLTLTKINFKLFKTWVKAKKLTLILRSVAFLPNFFQSIDFFKSSDFLRILVIFAKASGSSGRFDTLGFALRFFAVAGFGNKLAPIHIIIYIGSWPHFSSLVCYFGPILVRTATRNFLLYYSSTKKQDSPIHFFL